ncbi:MAG TPA: glycosyltransferase 87 family protein, partial [Candidatus Elarobacter sp.]|nr:glycosyltransferase 87 family protein [Candidatus Elarobacter sp.]
AAGATWNAGGDPWSRDIWRVERTIEGVDPAHDELLPYVGPAAALPLYGALAHLPFALAVRVWTVLLMLALAALALCALALARVHAQRRAQVDLAVAGIPAQAGAQHALTRLWAQLRTPYILAALGAVLFALASGAATSALALGQVALLSAAGIAAALVAYDRKAIVAGALGTLIAGLQPNLALALIARIRDRAALVSAALGALAFASLTFAAGGGVQGFIAYVHVLREHGNAERFVTIQHTPAAVAYAFGAPENVAAAIGIGCALIAIAAVVALTLAARLDSRSGTLLAIAALPLAVPFFHEHDFVVELIPLIVLAAVTRGAERGWAGVAAALVLVDWLDLAQRPAAAGQIVALGVAVAFAFVALGRGARATRADLAPFAAVAILACCAVPLARAFPAPTWPDMLPSAYRAPADANASAVWADEQRAAGLDARSAVWGALRTLPLTGCMLLAFCIITTTRAQRSKAARL